MATTLNVCSFKCKNIKTSVTELNDLCTNMTLFSYVAVSSRIANVISNK